MPIGISSGAIMVLAAMSAHSSAIAPIIADIGNIKANYIPGCSL